MFSAPPCSVVRPFRDGPHGLRFPFSSIISNPPLSPDRRGRVGRGAEQSYCVLMASDKQTSVAQQRLGIMEESSDGFRIAEKDLEIRGPGEVMGTRQSGVPTFRVGNLVRDLHILEDARREAEHYLTTRRRTRETSRLIERVRADARFGLAAIG